MIRNITTLLATAIFFFALSYITPIVPQVHAQASCSIEELFQSCGAASSGFSCISPTPSPIPEGQAWIKVKASNFNANNNDTFANFNIPASPLRFNITDTDDPTDGSGTFLSGDSTTEQGVITVPENSNNLPSSITADNNLVVTDYSKKKQLDPRKFLDYALSRKGLNTLSALDETPATDKINVYIQAENGNTPFTINSSNVDNFRAAGEADGPLILVIDGDLNINQDVNYDCANGFVNDTSGGSSSCTDLLTSYTPRALTLVVTGTTTISGAGVHQINAILLTNNLVVNAMADDQYGLKIKGNLIVSGTFTNNRNRAETRRPVIFIVLNSAMYTSLLPYFSTAQYEWKQIQ